MTPKSPSLFDWNIVGPAIGDAFKKLNPRLMIKNPVMFVTQVGATLTTAGIFTAPAQRGFVAQLAVWLWFTVLFAFEKQTDLKNYTGYQKRIAGFLGERLLTVWFQHNQLKVLVVDLLFVKLLVK